LVATGHLLGRGKPRLPLLLVSFDYRTSIKPIAKAMFPRVFVRLPGRGFRRAGFLEDLRI
jgi:hypothetical protein